MHTSRWALVNAARTLSARLASGWRQTPTRDRRAWRRLLAFGAATVVATLATCILLLRSVLDGANHFAWEETALRAIETGPLTFGNAVWLQTFGADTTLAFLVLTTAGLAAWFNRPLLAISILVTPLMMDATVRLGWLSFDRVRPTVIADGVASPGYRSFPSGHTAKTIAVYGLLVAQWLEASRSAIEKLLVAVLLLLLVLAVPFGRLRTGVHWPTDVMGGWLLGGIWLAFVLVALRHERSRA